MSFLKEAESQGLLSKFSTFFSLAHSHGRRDDEGSVTFVSALVHLKYTSVQGEDPTQVRTRYLITHCIAHH